MLPLEFCVLVGIMAVTIIMLNHVGISQQEVDAAWREATDSAHADSEEGEVREDAAT